MIFVRRTLIFGAIAICVLSIVRWLSHGIDLTDEGYYLNAVRYPKFEDSFSTWQVMARPFWILSFGNLGIYRFINLAFVVLLGVLLSRAVINSAGRIGSPLLAVLIGLSSLVGLRVWLPTINYNWINLQGLLLLWLGYFVRRSRFGGFCTALGLAMVVSAKPTTALLCLPLLLVSYLSSERRLDFATGFGQSVGLVVALYWFSGVSPLVFISEFRFMQKSVGILNGASFDVFRLDWSTYILQIRGHAFGVASSAVIGFLLSITQRSRKKNLRLTITTVAVICISTYVTMEPSQAILCAVSLCLTYSLFSLVTDLLRCPTRSDETFTKREKARDAVVVIALLITTYAYAFGTNIDYFYKMQDALIFAVLAGVLVAGRSLSMRVVFASLAVITATLSIGFGLGNPYRQDTAIPLQADSIETSDHFHLKVGKQTALFVSQVKDLLEVAGHQPADPILDLSGRSPGIVWLVGATPVGGAWTIGGYPGSEELLQLRLKRTDCKRIVRSWILREDGIYSELSVSRIFGSENVFRQFWYRVGEIRSTPINGVIASPTQLSVWSPKLNPDEGALPCEADR